MPNRLASSRSLYLRQHGEHAIDWYPWSDEAFLRAKAENKPVLISIGYSSCHWCHVMAHESFENAAVAAVLNDHFVCIKVDREENPDVDDAYMTAVQLATGRGGWPITVFATPDRDPFYAGTYIPLEDRGQYPGFLTACRQIAAVWKDRPQDIRESAEAFSVGLREAISAHAPAELERLSADDIVDAVRALESDFDEEFGGFGGAPKFPPHTAIDFLIAFSSSKFGTLELRDRTRSMALRALRAMVKGGIHDHVGGGYHRYSTDREWRLPHFEKMLYDNALMLRNLTALGEDFSDVLAWLQREMRSEVGLFYSAIDADSEGEEGRFYTWTVADLRAALGGDAQALIEQADITLGGNIRDEATGEATGANVIDLTHSTWDSVPRDLREKLLTYRARRPRPATDHKAIVAWNGLAIWALADCGQIELAVAAATEILSFPELPHAIYDREPFGTAYLDDYAMFCRGLIALNDATGDRKWLDHTRRLAVTMVQEFRDADGSFFATSGRHEALFGRAKPCFDGPQPSANAVALDVLALLGHEADAMRGLMAVVGWMHRAPQATEALYRVALRLVRSEAVKATRKPAAKVAMAPATSTDVEITTSRKDDQIEIRVSIPEGWRLYGPYAEAQKGEPTRIDVHGADAELVWSNVSTEITSELIVTANLFSPGPLVEVVVHYQACSDSACLLPMRRSFEFSS